MELLGNESRLKDDFVKQRQANSGTLFLYAPDIYYTAAILSSQAFMIGNGGRTELIYLILKQAKKCKAIVAKLQLLQRGKFHGFKIMHDKFKSLPEVVPIKRKTIFSLWLTLVR